jgi:hypothetical protein
MLYFTERLTLQVATLLEAGQCMMQEGDDEVDNCALPSGKHYLS